MSTIHHRAARHSLARAAALGLLTLTAALAAPGAQAATHPQPRDASGNLSNTVTSTSPGANCVTGTETGCYTVLATPMVNPAVAAGALTATGVGTVLLRRRRRTTTR
jgi:hypothetical protein